MTLARRTLLLTLVALGGCPDAPGWETFPAPELSATEAIPSTPSAPDAPEPTTGGGLMTTTLEPTSTTTTGAPDDTTGTTGAPLEPTILEPVVLSPNPIQSNGLIDVTVNTEHADGVRMQLDDGDELELDMTAPGVFGGSISAFTGLDNGKHVALFTPWRDLADGETVEAHYEIALPEPGSQGFWETGDLIGPGQVAAMGVLPDGDVIEFGTLSTPDGARCYLRRRDKGGAWFLGDVVTILPGVQCQAIDLAVDDQGVMFVLANREVGNDARWWLARIPAWKSEPAQLGVGAIKETAVAVAAHPSGTIAACGFAPSVMLDDDAKVWIFRPNVPGQSLSFDYHPMEGNKPPHAFYESPRDCIFAGDDLALVGEVNGWHGNENQQRDRLFSLLFDVDAPETVTWNVAPMGVKPQSGAQAVAVDELGRLVVAGYVCGDTCQPEADLRIYDAQWDIPYLAPLGTFPTKQFAVQDLRWSPAGYAVVATGGTPGNESAFTVRAFNPAKVEPEWTFARKDLGVLNLALALAIGEFGEIYAGGLGENGYPAVAYIGG